MNPIPASMETSMHLQKAYERVPNFESLAREARVRFVEWKIIFALDGLKTGADIALLFGLSEARTNEIFDRLIGRGIIAEVEIGLEDYLQRTRPLRPEMSADFASDPAARMRAIATTTGGLEAGGEASPAPRISASISRRSSVPKPPVVEAGLNGQGASADSESAVDLGPKKRFRLKSAIDFIQGHAGGGTLGQLAVYRALMLIPSDLLRETGLRRLDFSDETVEIESPKLRQAIVDAIGKALRVELPVAYFLE